MTSKLKTIALTVGTTLILNGCSWFDSSPQTKKYKPAAQTYETCMEASTIKKRYPASWRRSLYCTTKYILGKI